MLRQWPGVALVALGTSSVGVLFFGLLSFGTGCGPLPGDRDGGAVIPQRDIVTIPTDDHRYFYLVDTRREVCFFGDRYRPQLTKIECQDIPEAWDLFGWEMAPEGDADGEGEGIPSLPPPGDEEGATDNGVAPPPLADPGPPPTPEERQAFETAFVERFCASRTPPDEGAEDEARPPDEATVAERHGLTPERYQQLRIHLSADADAWRALSQRALQSCP